jgi:hypothetical protein
MSGFVKEQVNGVEIEHFSTSSQIKITIKDDDGTQNIWLDYSQFDDLKKVVNKVCLGW